MKRRALGALQLLIGAAIVGVIFYRLNAKGDLHELGQAMQSATGNLAYLVPGFLMFGVCLFFCTVRWQAVLLAQGFEIPFRRLSALYFIGHFFNAFLPGATGGDLVKAFYLVRETRERRTEVVMSIFLERTMGLIAMIILTVSVMLIRLPFFLEFRVTRLALCFNLVLAALATLGLVTVLRRDAFEKWRLFRKLESSTRLGEHLTRAYRSFHFCLNHPPLLVGTIFLSLCNHFAMLASVYLVGLSIGINLTFWNYVTAFLVINAIAALPITPNGIGTRETASIFMLGVFLVPDSMAVTLSLLIYATVLLWSLVGGVVYMVYAARMGRVAKEVLEETLPADVGAAQSP